MNDQFRQNDIDDDLSPDTLLVHGGTARSGFGETSEAMFLNSGFVYDNAEAAEARFKGEAAGFIYSRYANPTVDMFEKRMALIEGAEAARGTASGMAAVTAALLCQLKAGDHVVSSRALFGSCLYVIEDLLTRYGVPCTLVDGTDIDQWKAAVRPNTRALFLESPTNPTLEVADIAGVAVGSAGRPAVGTRCGHSTAAGGAAVPQPYTGRRCRPVAAASDSGGVRTDEVRPADPEGARLAERHPGRRGPAG